MDATAKCRVIPAGREKCGIPVPAPFAVVIFGASGDLTKRKLIPSMYHLMLDGHLPDEFLVLGTALEDWDDAGFRVRMKEAVREAYPSEFSEAAWGGFADRLYYMPGRFDDPNFYKSLADRLAPLEKRHKTKGNRIFYLAIPPSADL